MSGVAAATFLSQFRDRLLPSLAFSALPVALQVSQNPDILSTDEGRKEMLAMGGASLLSAAVGAGLGAGLHQAGTALFPGKMGMTANSEIAGAFNKINQAKGVKTPISLESSVDDMTAAYNIGAKNLKGQQLEELQKALTTVKQARTAPNYETMRLERMPSRVGGALGTIGDVGGGMASWSPIYMALAGTPTQPAEPGSEMSPEEYNQVLRAQGLSSQEDIINQQLMARLAQGDGLPVSDYSNGTMFNNAGLNSNIYDPSLMYS